MNRHLTYLPAPSDQIRACRQEGISPARALIETRLRFATETPEQRFWVFSSPQSKLVRYLGLYAQ